MTFDELLKQMVQTQRKQAPAVLYGGDLQDNTTLSFNEQKYEETPVDNKSNKILFNTYGSSITERDDRMFMTPQPQVPANPELEALNDYFSQRRVEQFAKASQGAIVGEVLQKQAEQTASTIVRDEMDRRAGIRRAVLERTGLTPAQIQTQMVSEGLAGINPRTFDMREQQITDAVNLYYNINNIPPPVTTPMTDATPSTTPSGTIQPPTEPTLPTPAPEIPGPETPEAPEPEIVPTEPARRRRRDPEFIEGLPRFTTGDEIGMANRRTLASYIVTYNIRDVETTTRSGELKSFKSLMNLNLPTLQSIVLDDLLRSEGRAGSGNRVPNKSLIPDPSSLPEPDEVD
jgi:hypothetical protein